LIEQFATPGIRFLGEQDGPAERRLKEALAVVLGLDPSLIRAYLARVLCDGKTAGVILGLLTSDEEDSEKIAAQAGKTSAAMFNARAQIDIVFLNHAQDAEIAKVCPPFFARNA